MNSVQNVGSMRFLCERLQKLNLSSINHAGINRQAVTSARSSLAGSPGGKIIRQAEKRIRQESGKTIRQFTPFIMHSVRASTVSEILLMKAAPFGA